jgi:signal transduction histidine kinase
VVHRAGNDLGLVGAYIDDIREKLDETGGGSPLITEKLEKIARAAQRVLELATNIKQPLGEAGKATVIAPAILLEEVYTQIVASLPPHTQIDLHIEDDVRPVEVVYNQIIDILHNLVANAREAMPAGGKILLKACNDCGHVALQVIDTGGGIPPDLLPKIFDLSFSTKGSSGFGLWSARTYAIKNNGALQADSQVGKGTTFTLLLPAVLDLKRVKHA